MLTEFYRLKFVGRSVSIGVALVLVFGLVLTITAWTARGENFSTEERRRIMDFVLKQKSTSPSFDSEQCLTHHRVPLNLAREVAVNGFFSAVKIEQTAEFACEGRWLSEMLGSQLAQGDSAMTLALVRRSPDLLEISKRPRFETPSGSQTKLLNSLVPSLEKIADLDSKILKLQNELTALRKSHRVMTEHGYVDAPPIDQEAILLSKIRAVGMVREAAYDSASMGRHPLIRSFISHHAQKMSSESPQSSFNFLKTALDQKSEFSLSRMVLQPLSDAHKRERDAALKMAATGNEDQWRNRLKVLGVEAELANYSAGQPLARQRIEEKFGAEPNPLAVLAGDLARDGSVEVISDTLIATGVAAPIGLALKTTNDLYTVLRDDCGPTLGFTGYRKGYCQALDGDPSNLSFNGAMLEESGCLKYAGLAILTGGIGAKVYKKFKAIRKISLPTSHLRPRSTYHLRAAGKYGGDPKLRISPMTFEELLISGERNQELLNDSITRLGNKGGYGVIAARKKTAESIVEKINAGKNDFSQVFDSARATILVNSPEQIKDITLRAKKSFGKTGFMDDQFELLDWSGGFDRPRGSGYRDMKLLFRHKANRGIVELQVQIPQMYIAKQAADKEYHFRRLLMGQLGGELAEDSKTYRYPSALREKLNGRNLSNSERLADQSILSEYELLENEILASEAKEKRIFDEAWAAFQAQL